MRIAFQTALGLGFCGVAVASVSGASIQAYNATSATQGGAGGLLNIGREFTVSGSGIDVSDLGVYDNAGHVLLNSHDVTLFSISSFGNPTPAVTPLATVTVAVGGSSTSDFVFASLSSPVHLAPGKYAVVAYGLDNPNNGGDPYGDNVGTGGLADGITTPNVADDAYAGSRFDPFQFPNPYAGSPAFPVGGDSNNHSSTSFLYTVSTPEPGTIGLIALGAVGFLARRRT